MELVKLIRTLVQIFALGIFVFQMQNSIRKYISRPVVQQSSTTTFDSIPKPVIFVCEDGQFNYEKARQNGYKSFSRFNLGILSDTTTISWRGKNGNLSFKELQEDIFDYDYSTFVHQTSLTGDDYKWTDAPADLVYFIPQKFCMKPKQTLKGMNFRSTKKSFLYLDDPEKTNGLRITRIDSWKGELGPTGNLTFNGKLYEVQISIHDSKVHDGLTCTDYKKIGTSYGECVENEFKRELLGWFGCLPPWFPKKIENLECSDAKTANTPGFDALVEIIKLIKGLDLKVAESCLPPCTTMSWKLKELYHQTNVEKYSYIELKIMDNIIVYTDVCAYDVFSLVVDLGSSIGLWLGLSAVGIFDYLFDFYAYVQSKLTNKI